jgi:hypothetical protein
VFGGAFFFEQTSGQSQQLATPDVWVFNFAPLSSVSPADLVAVFVGPSIAVHI